MIELTQAAKAQLESYFSGKDPVPVRIYLASGG